MAKTAEDTRDYVGGGDRKFEQSETELFAGKVAESDNAFERWAETRSLEDRIATRTATVRDADGNETQVETPAIVDGATTTPEGFGGADDDDEEE